MARNRRSVKVAFITNMCNHYVRPLFEILAERYNVEFYFTGGHEAYWHKPNELKSGQFKGEYLPGIMLLQKFKITPRLLKLRWWQYDIIIKTIDDRFALPLVFLAAKICRKPFILWTGLWAHPGSAAHKFSYQPTKYIYKNSDAIITYGTHVQSYLIKEGIDPAKIFCANHATDNSAYNRPVSTEEKVQLRSALGILEHMNIILYIGRLEDGKGLDILVNAMAMLEAKGTMLLMVGTGSLEHALRAQCEGLKIPVVFAGHVPNEQLYAYYAIADIFVLPSVTTAHFKEPWGMVINEAMNQGCPVITTTAVGAAAGGLVEHGRTGLIVEEKNTVELANALKCLLADRGWRARMGVMARRTMEEWTPHASSLGFDAAIDHVLNKGSHKA